MPKVYSTTNCPWCVKMKTWLKEHGVDYQEFLVDRDAEARKELRETYHASSVPVLVYKDKVIMGFDTKTLEELFAAK